MIASRVADWMGLVEPIACESPSSWVSRAALGQGVSVKKLMAHIGWDFTIDIDWEFGQHYIDGFSVEDTHMQGFEIARRLMSGLARSGCSPTRFLLSVVVHHRRHCTYRFCPLCLRDFSVPHIPQHWRFTAWRCCPEHACMMEDRCMSCRKPLRLPIGFLSASAKKLGVHDVGRCYSCGLALATIQPVSLEAAAADGRLTDHDFLLLDHGRALIASLFHGELGILPGGIRQPLTELRLLDECALLPNANNPPRASALRALALSRSRRAELAIKRYESLAALIAGARAPDIQTLDSCGRGCQTELAKSP